VRFRFVRDGFHVWAFLLGPLWILWHRLWLVLLGYVIVIAALQAGLWLLGAGSGMTFLAGALIELLVGFEAPTLRRWTLARRGWATIGVVAADDREGAERRFFDAWSGATPHRPQWEAPASMTGGFHAPLSQSPAVFGLFPEPGARR
jgi:hypothetical protein